MIPRNSSKKPGRSPKKPKVSRFHNSGYKSMQQQKIMANDWVAREAWDCNVIMELVDIRNIDGTRIPFLKKFGSVDKILTIANKRDLATPELIKACCDRGILTISATSKNREATRRQVLDAIMSKSSRPKIKVAIFGYPNVGKSTLVNLLIDRKKAVVSPVAFTTKGRQMFRLNDRVFLMDLPGVYPGKQAKADLIFKGAVNIQGLSDPEDVFIQLYDRKSGDQAFFSWLESTFGIVLEGGDRSDPFDVLGKIAFRRGFLLKGGEPDTQNAARLVLSKLATAPFSA